VKNNRVENIIHTIVFFHWSIFLLFKKQQADIAQTSPLLRNFFNSKIQRLLVVYSLHTSRLDTIINRKFYIFLLLGGAITNTTWALATLADNNYLLALVWMLLTAIILTILGDKIIK
jgi:hypothetical protein